MRKDMDSMITVANEIQGKKQHIRKEWWFDAECEKVTTEKIEQTKRRYGKVEKEIWCKIIATDDRGMGTRKENA
jgi:hypothetical protein